MEAIQPGTRLEVTDVLGRSFVKVALTQVERTGAFPAVWACSEEEWAIAKDLVAEPEPEPFPWPLRAIKVLN